MDPYASLDDVKSWLGITTAVADDLLTKLLDAATAFINEQIGRPNGLWSTAYSEEYHGHNNHRLMLRNWPVTSVALVQMNGQTVPKSTAYGVSGWVVDPGQRSLLMRGGDVFAWGTLNVTVSYVAGYAAIPADLQQACIELVGFKYKTRDTTAAGWVSKSLAGETVSFSQRDMSSAVKTTLNAYKAPFAI